MVLRCASVSAYYLEHSYGTALILSLSVTLFSLPKK